MTSISDEPAATVEAADPPTADATGVRAFGGIGLLQGRPAMRLALVVIQQLIAAAEIYTVAALVWKALSGGAGRPGVVTVVGATIVVATVLTWSRPAFERLANWLAFGERADGFGLAVNFLKRLGTSIELEEVLPRLAETAARTVGSQRGEVRVWLADGSTWKKTWPQGISDDEGGTVIAVRHSGDPVGEMTVGIPAVELSPPDRRLLDELAGPAGLALATVRLTHALRQRAAEIDDTAAQIRASRDRIIEARRDEQVRIRDQVRNRIRPELDAVGGLLQLDRTPGDNILSEAAGHVDRAIEAVRFLARGVFPTRLAEAGLAAALRGWAEEMGRPIEISVIGPRPRLQENPDLDAALYFCVVTAIGATAGGADVAIEVGTTEATATVRLARWPDQVTLRAVSDRVEAFDGTATCDATEDPRAALVHLRVPIPAGRQ
jgi:signal transduction histidine kinase